MYNNPIQQITHKKETKKCEKKGNKTRQKKEKKNVHKNSDKKLQKEGEKRLQKSENLGNATKKSKKPDDKNKSNKK